MGIQANEQTESIDVFVYDESGAQAPIGNAPVRILAAAHAAAGDAEKPKPRRSPAELEVCYEEVLETGHTAADGHFRSTRSLGTGPRRVEVDAFGLKRFADVELRPVCEDRVRIAVPVEFTVETYIAGSDCTTTPCERVRQGQSMYVRLAWSKAVTKDLRSSLTVTKGSVLSQYRDYEDQQRVVREYVYDSSRVFGHMQFTAVLKQNPEIVVTANGFVDRDEQAISGDVTVSMRRAATEITDDLPLWIVIRKSTEALSFNNYQRFMDHVLCGEPLSPDFTDFEASKIPAKRDKFNRLQTQRFLPFTDADSYRILKAATEAFVMVNCAVALNVFPFDADDLDYVVKRIGRAVELGGLWDKYLRAVNGTPNAILPYYAVILQKLPDVRIKNAFPAIPEFPEECFGILREKLTAPCLLELIWSYWHEEGMLAQTVNAITRRFQNVRGQNTPDPLGNLEIDPLRPLNNLFWGYLQDEQHRLSVVRRNYEYDHHYGIRLEGKAVREFRAADTRSKFLEAFHNLLHLCAGFFKQDDDTTIVADGFPMLNALKEVHLILSQGAHNQYGDLPSTARIEMLMQEWLLARPEFREFLPTRIMVAYPEPWMDRVDAMKKIQGWTDTSVLNFRNLGIFGEQVLLSIRYGNWSEVNDPVQAANWARFWRPEIQGYTHAYRSVTGVDLTAANVGGAIDSTLPSLLLQKRLATQVRTA